MPALRPRGPAAPSFLCPGTALGAAVTWGRASRPPRLPGADVVPPARPSGSRGQPLPAQGSSRAGSRPLPGPLRSPKGVPGRGNGEGKQEPRLRLGGSSPGRKRRGGRRPSAPFPPPAAGRGAGGSCPGTAARRGSRRENGGGGRGRAPGSARHRLLTAPQPRGSSRPQPVLGEVPGCIQPLFISCPRGHVYRKNGKDGSWMCT